jgi:hypothetical protein
MRSAEDDPEGKVELRPPDEPPTLYPQAAFLLRRIVERLVERRRAAGESSGTEEAS